MTSSEIENAKLKNHRELELSEILEAKDFVRYDWLKRQSLEETFKTKPTQVANNGNSQLLTSAKTERMNFTATSKVPNVYTG